MIVSGLAARHGYPAFIARRVTVPSFHADLLPGGLPGVRGSRAIPREPFRPPAACPPEEHATRRWRYPTKGLLPFVTRCVTRRRRPGVKSLGAFTAPAVCHPELWPNFLRPLHVIVTRRYHYPAFESRVTVFLSYPASYPAQLPGVHPAPGNRLYPESYPARLPGVRARATAPAVYHPKL